MKVKIFKKVKIFSKRFFISVLAFLVIMVSGGYLYLFNPFNKVAEAAWFDENWAYRESIDLPTHSGSESNVYITLTVNTSTLISNSKLQSSCQDLRFTQKNGDALQYYIVSGCNTSSTSINVNFATYPAGLVTIYMYYGNPSAIAGTQLANFSTSASNNSSSATLNLQVGANDNDGTDQTGSGTFHTLGNPDDTPAWTDSHRLVLGGKNTSGTTLTGGLRFTGVTVPQGATITSATFDVQEGVCPCNYLTHVKVKVYGSLQSDVSSVFSNSNLPRNITKTSASATWNSTSETINNDTWLSASASNQPPSITSIIQEVVNQAGWVSGNSIALIFADNGSDNDWWWEMNPYEHGAASAGKLSITYNSTLSVTYGSEEKAPTPSAYWKFDEGYGTTTTDSSSNKIAGTLAGTTKPTWQNFDQCISGKCLFFDGSTSKVTVATAINNIQTIAMWIRPNIISSSALIDLDAGTHKVTVSSGTISTSGFSQSTIYVNGLASSTIIANQWSYVVITTTDSSINSTSSLTIGLSGSTFFKGYIDEVKIYDYTRSASQILSDYNSRGSLGAGANVSGALRNQPNALSNGLSGYWKMDQTSWNGTAGEVVDSTGNGNNGTATCTGGGCTVPTTTGGKFGNGGSFDGVDDYVSVASSATLLPTTGITISVWINPTLGSGAKYIVEKTNDYEILLGNSGTNQISYALGNTSPGWAFRNTGVSAVAGWQLLTLTYDGVTENFYQNGLLIYSQSGNGNLPSSNSNAVQFGCPISCTANFYPGTMDEVRIYNRALSSSDVQTLYNFAPGPTGYWNFEDNNGTTIHDLSGKANDMTWHGTGTTHWTGGPFGAAGGFNGSDDYADVSDNSAFSFGTSDFTIMAWIKFPLNSFSASPLNAGIINKGGSTSAPANTWTVYASNPITRLKYADSVDAGGSFNVNYSFTNQPSSGWHHIAITRSSGTSYKFYYDGSLDGSTTAGATVNLTNSANFEFGRTSSGTPRYTQTSLDDVKIYNYARTQSQIEEDENATHPLGGSPFGSEIGYWKFDEGYGTTANDSSASNNPGTLTNMASPATSTSGWSNSGKFNKALSFDGSNDYVTLTSDVNALKITDAITLSAWINLTDTASTYDIISKWTGTASTSSYDLFTDSSGKLNMKISSSGSSITTTTGNTTLAAGTWYHVVGVYIPNTSVSLYINGVLDKQNTSSIPSALHANTTVVDIGAENAGTNPFKGSIDEVKVYGEALTQPQISIDYNKGSAEVFGALSNNSSYQKQAANQIYCVPGDATSCAAPTIEWLQEDGTGTSANDTSGNANTGTLDNSPAWGTGKIGKALLFSSSAETDIRKSSFLPTAKTFTFEAWIYPTSLGASNLGRVFQHNTNFLLYLDASSLFNMESTNWSTTNGLWQTNSNTVTLNKWNYVTETYDGTSSSNNPIFYINGIPQKVNTTTPPSGTMTLGSSQFVVGNNSGPSGTRGFDGYIDQVRFFSYIRTPAQVAWDYNQGGPVAWYKFNECQGSTANDSSVNGYSGTINIGASGSQTAVGTCTDANNAHAWNNGVNGKINYSLKLDGTDDDITTSAFSPLAAATLTTTSISWGGWFFPTTSAASKTLMEKATEFQLTTDASSKPICGVYYSGAFHNSSAPTPTLNLGAWNHVLCTYDGTNINTYLNGLLVKQSSETNNVTAASSVLYMGETSGGVNFYSGQLDDLRIYNYALTATQVTTLYNNGAVNFAPTTGAP